MDSSHVSLVSISLEADGFEPYRCDRNVILGMETANLSKILKCASNDDSITIKAEEGGDMVTFQFDSQSKYCLKFQCSELNFTQTWQPKIFKWSSEVKYLLNLPTSLPVGKKDTLWLANLLIKAGNCLQG